MYLQLNSFQKLLGSTPTPSRLSPPYNTFISLNLVRNRALPCLSLSFTHKIQSLNPIISDDANYLGRPLPLLCGSSFIFSHWTTAMASKPVSLFWASLTSIFPPHTGCWSNLPKAWTQTCPLLFKSSIWYPSRTSVWVRSKLPNHAFWKGHQTAVPSSNPLHRSSPAWLPLTTCCSRATTWHIMPLLARLSLVPSPSWNLLSFKAQFKYYKIYETFCRPLWYNPSSSWLPHDTLSSSLLLLSFATASEVSSSHTRAKCHLSL